MVSLADKDGSILDQKEFNFKTSLIPQKENPENSNLMLSLIIIILLVVVLIGLYMKKKKKNINNIDQNNSENTENSSNITMGILAFILLVGGVVGLNLMKIERAKAVVDDGPAEKPVVNLVGNIDKDAYFVGDRIFVTATSQLGLCSNNISLYKLSISIGNGNIRDFYSDTGQETIYANTMYIAPSAGSYYMKFVVNVDGATVTKTKSFTVLEKPIPGLEVNGSTNPTAVNVGSNVYVQWKPQYSKSCSCYCYNQSGSLINCGDTSSKSCGSGVDETQRSTPYPIPSLSQKTTFKVTCTSLDYTPSTTSTTTTGGLTAL